MVTGHQLGVFQLEFWIHRASAKSERKGKIWFLKAEKRVLTSATSNPDLWTKVSNVHIFKEGDFLHFLAPFRRKQNRASIQNWRIIAFFLGVRVMPSRVSENDICILHINVLVPEGEIQATPDTEAWCLVYFRCLSTPNWLAAQNKIQTGYQEGESNIKSFQLETCPRSFHTFQLLYRIPKLLLFRCSTKFWRIFGNKSWTFCFSLSEQSNLRIKRVSASCRQKHPSRLSTLEKTNLKQFFTVILIVVWKLELVLDDSKIGG